MSLYIRAYKKAGKVYKRVWAYDFTVRAALPSGPKTKRCFGVLGNVGALTKTAAKLRYQRIRKEAEESLWFQSLAGNSASHPSPPFSEFAPLFLAQYRTGNAVSSHARLTRAYKMLAPVFDAKRLDEITGRDIEGYKTQMFADGCSPYTINLNRRFLKQMFDLAMDWGLVQQHPLAKVARLREPMSQRTLSPQEEAQLLEACRDRFRAVVILGLDTGLRVGDLLALRWRDIDLRQRLIRVPPREASRNTRRPKTEQARLVGMTTRVFDLLSQLWQDDAEALVVTYAYSSIDSLFGQAVKRAGIAHMRFHDLRHSFGTRLVQADVQLEKVRQVMGHARIQTTQRYVHLSDRDTARVVEVLNPDGLPTNPPTSQEQRKKWQK